MTFGRRSPEFIIAQALATHLQELQMTPQQEKHLRGLFDKFVVVRTDGKSAEGQKHHDCEYFVLDCDHDKHAVAALLAYAESARDELPVLSEDLRTLASVTALRTNSTGSLKRQADSDELRAQVAKRMAVYAIDIDGLAGASEATRELVQKLAEWHLRETASLRMMRDQALVGRWLDSERIDKLETLAILKGEVPLCHDYDADTERFSVVNNTNVLDFGQGHTLRIALDGVQLQPCPTCHGSKVSREDHGNGAVEELACHDCIGTGKVPGKA